jgi:hypothetical protein
MTEPTIRETDIYGLCLPASEDRGQFGNLLEHLAANLEEEPQRSVLSLVIAQEDGFEADDWPWTATVVLERRTTGSADV